MKRFELNQDKPTRGRTDWRRVDAQSEEEILHAVRSDAEAKPASDGMLARMKRVPNVREIRRTLGLSIEEFSAAYGIAAARVRAWEEGRQHILPTEQTLLRAISAQPDMVRLALSDRGHARTSQQTAYSVVRSTGGWAVRKSGASRATSIHETQSTAIKAARDIAQRHKVDLVIYGRDGQVRLRRRYGRRQAEANC